jgi:hypothetical protein
MPKYDHVQLAVINPSPSRKRSQAATKHYALDLEADMYPIKPKPKNEREIPQHLVKPPIEQSASML